MTITIALLRYPTHRLYTVADNILKSAFILSVGLTCVCFMVCWYVYFSSVVASGSHFIKGVLHRRFKY